MKQIYVVSIKGEPKKAFSNYAAAESFIKNFEDSLYSKEDIVKWDLEAFEQREENGDYSFEDSVTGIKTLHPELDVEKIENTLNFYDDYFDEYLECISERIKIYQIPLC